MGFFPSLNWKHVLIVLAICSLFFGLRLYKIDLAVNSYYTGYDWATYYLGSEAIVNGKTLYDDVMIPHPFIAYITYSGLSHILGHTFFDYLRISVFISFLVLLTIYYFFGFVVRDMRYAHIAALLYSIDPLITTLDRGIMLETTGFLYFLWALIFLYFALQSVRRYNIGYIFLFLIFGALASLTKLIFLIPTLFVIGFLVMERRIPGISYKIADFIFSRKFLIGLLLGTGIYYIGASIRDLLFHTHSFLPFIHTAGAFDYIGTTPIQLYWLCLLVGVTLLQWKLLREILSQVSGDIIYLMRDLILLVACFVIVRSSVEIGYLILQGIDVGNYYQYVYLNQFGRTTEITGLQLIVNTQSIWTLERCFIIFYFLLLVVILMGFSSSDIFGKNRGKTSIFLAITQLVFVFVSFYFFFSRIGGIPRYLYMGYILGTVLLFPFLFSIMKRHLAYVGISAIVVYSLIVHVLYVIPGYAGDTLGWRPFNDEKHETPIDLQKTITTAISNHSKILSTSPAFYLQYSQYLSHDNWFISRHYDTFANLFLLSTTLEPEKYIAKLITDNVGVYILDPWSATWGGGYGVIMDSLKAYTRDTFELVSKNTDFTIYKIIRIYKENGFSALFHTGERKISFIHPKTFASIYLYPATTSALAQTFSDYRYTGDPSKNMNIALPIGAYSGVLDMDISLTGSMYTVEFTLSGAIKKETIRPYLLDYLSNWGRTGIVTMDNKSLQLDSVTGFIELSDDVKDHNLHIDLDTVSIDVGFRDGTIDALEYVYSPTMGLKSIIPVCSQADKCTFTLLFTQK